MSVRVALLMDPGPEQRYHAATAAALRAAGADVALDWVPTSQLSDPGVRARVETAGGIVVGPCSPYDDKEAVLDVIGWARRELIPLVGT